MEHHAINHAVHRCRGHDAQRQREDRQRAKPGRPAKNAQTVAEILAELFQPGPAPGIARLFFENGGIAERAHGGLAGSFGAHAGGDVLGDLLIEMTLEFVVQSVSPSMAME